MEWKWGSADASRAKNAAKVKLIQFNDSEYPSIECEGSGGAIYHTTLYECTCKDFSINRQKGNAIPCKHMVRLAMQLGILNKSGLTEADQRKSEKDKYINDFYALESKLALYAWYYYVCDKPTVSDAEYDSLKRQYMEMKNNIE